jgi:hypothetical protein
MSVNLVLNSSDSISYASGRAQFKVHWSQFLDDPDATYKVSFSFITAVDANLDENDLYTLHLDNVATLKNISGGEYNSGTSKAIGFVYSEEPHSSHARLRAEFSTNPPVDLVSRPNEDILNVSFRDLDGVLLQKTPQFILFLRFEKKSCLC